jgi:hypothetical protein
MLVLEEFGEKKEDEREKNGGKASLEGNYNII